MPKNPYADTPAGVLRKLNEKWKKHHTWVSPTGHETPTNWLNPAQAYDGNTATPAQAPNGVAGWSEFLVLTIDSIPSNALRFFVENGGLAFTPVDVDVYDGSSWIHVYEGDYANAVWNVKNFSTTTVSKARFRITSVYIEYVGWVGGPLHEFEFWEVPPPAWGGDTHHVQMAKAILGL